jgi:YVTN family beta-propeller protein
MKRIPAIIICCIFLAAICTSARADWITKTITPGSQPRGVAINPVTNKIYVTNESSGNVTVIDGTTNATTTVACGSWPQGIDVNPVTNQIYLVNAISSTATIIDGATNDTSIVPVGSSAYTIAVNPATNKAYAVNGGSNSVTVIDGSTLTTTTVAVGSSPRYAAINPVTNQIYVVNRSGNSVTVIDGATNATTTVAVGANPQGVVVNAATNKIYVANYNSNTVTEIDGTTNDTVSIATAAGPGPMAVNPATNKIYVGCSANRVMLIDGATRDTVGIAAGAFIGSISVNPVTNKIYVVNSGAGASLLVINGQNNKTTTITSGTMTPFLRAVAVNPITNKIYIPVDRNDGVNYNVTVVDGSNADTANVATGGGPTGVALNPITNMAYTSNYWSNTVTAINCRTLACTTITAGSFPVAITLNPVTNRIYCGNISSGTVTVINGYDNTTTTLPYIGQPEKFAVNAITDKIYVCNANNTISVIDGAANTIDTLLLIPNPASPEGIALNPATNRIYVSNAGDNTVIEIDGATRDTAVIPVGVFPGGLAVNPVTNKIYVCNRTSNTVSIIDGITHAVASVTAGTLPYMAAVNPVTNKIYVANNNSDNITIIDGSNNTAVNIAGGDRPYSVAVNTVTNKVYVANYNSNNITVIDGATNATMTIPAGTNANSIAVDATTNKVYCSNFNGNNLTVISPVPDVDAHVRAIIDSLPGNRSYQPQPTLTGRAVNRWSPYRTGMMGVTNDWMAGQHEWSWAAGPYSGSPADSISWTYNWGSDSLLFGENIINIVPLEMQAGGTNNTGIGSAMAGNMLTYPVYYLDSIPPEQVALISPAINSYISDSSISFIWHEAKDNYDLGHYRVQIAANDSFSPIFVDTAIYDTSAMLILSSADSVYYWRVRAVDACGNIGQFSETRQFELDVTGPYTPTLLTPANNAWLSTDTAFCSWSAVTKSGKASPVYYIFKAYNLSDTINPIKCDTTYNTIDTVNVGQGRYRWLVEAHDQAGNLPGISEYYHFGYDVTPPSEAMLIIPADSLITNQDSISFCWHPCSDSISGMRDYKLQYAYDLSFASGLAETTLTDTAINLILPDSNYFWRVVSNDTAGNSNYSDVWYLSVDTHDPNAPNLMTPANNTWLAIDTAFCTWSAVAKSVKASAVYYVFKAYLLPDTINPLVVDTTYQTGDTILIGQGRYRWLVEAHDEAGNPPGLSGYYNFGYDKTPPVSPIVQISPTDSLVTNQSNVTFCWHPSTDAVSGIKEYAVVYAYDESFSTGLAETTLTDTSIVLNLPDSIYYWMVEARDTVGNVGVSYVWQLNVDTHDPDVPALASPSDNIWTDDTTVVFAWTEVVKKSKASEVSYILQLDSNNAFTAPIIEDTTNILLDTFNLAEGWYFWRVMAYDAAGNYGTYSTYRTFGIDTTAPIIQYVDSLTDDTYPPYGPYLVQSMIYDQSGVENVWLFYQINSGSWDSSAMWIQADTLCDTIPTQDVPIHEEWPVNYYIKAEDLLGHIKVSSTYLFTLCGPIGVSGKPERSMPTVYALDNAYPNPSRGQTTFKYQLPKESKVSLSIYNVVGQMIKRFDVGAKPAGYHQVNWNDNMLPNGVYIYQLKAGTFTSTKKMMVIR